MNWDVALWIALALLATVIVTRIVAARSGSKQRSNPIVRGKTVPLATLVIVIFVAAMRFGPGLLDPKPDWSEAELVEVEMLRDALAHYAQATVTRDNTALAFGDWETIRALLDAAASEMSMVSGEVLRKVHPELPSRVDKDFLPGLRLGIYGLIHFTRLPQKGMKGKQDPIRVAANDSMAQGRALLESWNTWFGANAEEIIERIE